MYQMLVIEKSLYLNITPPCKVGLNKSSYKRQNKTDLALQNILWHKVFHEFIEEVKS